MTQTSQRIPAYTADHPPIPDSDDLRARIPGWGADLNKEDRPSVPKLKFLDTGAHWDFPERQPEKSPRERSVEHRFLTPVFGTAQPLGGISGAIRKFAYKFSEGRAAHWMILLYADRVDAGEHHVRSKKGPAFGSSDRVIHPKPHGYANSQRETDCRTASSILNVIQRPNACYCDSE